MQWTKWRWLRLIFLAILVMILAKPYLAESNQQLPWLSSQENQPSYLLEPLNQVITPSALPTQEATTVTPVQVKLQLTPAATRRPTPIVFPEISNSSVLTAINQYRSDHQVHQLVEHASLCRYAEKRVQDLVAHGGLDEHAGFRADFADDKIPTQLEGYPGRTIGENLAYQYCINMQTEESFIANSAAALIEWCFDSSTKGHREAQLNPEFNNVCVRHQNGLFVVIFGD